MKQNINIAVIGLGQIGIYLYSELQKKKKLIELKTGKKIRIVGISAKNKNKKRRFTIDKKIFFSNPLDIIKKTNVDILFESIGLSDGISKKIVETSGSINFSLDDKYIFYSKLDENHRARKIYRHKIIKNSCWITN